MKDNLPTLIFSISMLYKAITGETMHPEYIQAYYTDVEQRELHEKLLEIYNRRN